MTKTERRAISQHAQVGNLAEYRGYAVRRSFDGFLFVERSGRHVCWASSFVDAQDQIDTLVTK